MASRSDSGNETRESSSSSDNSPTPPAVPQSVKIINTKINPVSRTTPTTTPVPAQAKMRLTPTAGNRQPGRPLPRRPPSSGLGPIMGPLTSMRARQRNSVAIVDSRDHIYEELELCKGPPKIAPVSGVLPQGKAVIRPIAFKPVVTFSGTLSSGPATPSQGVPVIGRPDPRYTSAPTLNRGPIHHYGSMGDLKTVGAVAYSLDRRGLGPTQRTLHVNHPQEYSDKFNSLTKLHNSKNSLLNNKSSPPYTSVAPVRPPSHQSACGNPDDGLVHKRMPLDSKLSSTADLHRFESLRTLPVETPHSFSHPHQINLLHRMGGSVNNLTHLSTTHANAVQALDRCNSNAALDRSTSGSNIGLNRSVNNSSLGLDKTLGSRGSVSGSLSELTLDNHHQTPSPSDSGVAELEAMLKEKDTEINSLRETMEHNEQVIFKVYEEKEKTWERELKKIRDIYEGRLKDSQQKALKVEQSLTTQTYQLQQERRKLSAEIEEIRREKSTCQSQVEQLKKEVAGLRQQLEETEWGLCQKSGEISLLKTQLKDSQGDQTTRGHELLHLRAQVRQYQQEIERRRAEISSLHDLTGQLRREMSELRSKLEQAQQGRFLDQDAASQFEKMKLDMDAARRESETQRKHFEDERTRWLEEKERVIKYQKQLHHNYVAMFGRNRQLEEEVARLTGVPLPSGNNGPAPLYADVREVTPSVTESRC